MQIFLTLYANEYATLTVAFIFVCVILTLYVSIVFIILCVKDENVYIVTESN